MAHSVKTRLPEQAGGKTKGNSKRTPAGAFAGSLRNQGRCDLLGGLGVGWGGWGGGWGGGVELMGMGGWSGVSYNL